MKRVIFLQLVTLASSTILVWRG